MRTQKSFLRIFHKSSRSALIKAVMKYLNLVSSRSKLKSVTCKFIKYLTPSQLFFKEFHYKCRAAKLGNASWWLLLRTTLFWEYSWTAAFQRQLQVIFILKILDFTMHFLLWRHVKEGRIFMDFFLTKSFDEKCKQTKLALDFIQKQYFSLKRHIFSSL